MIDPFDLDFYKQWILTGTVIFKIVSDENGNITKEIVDPNDLSGQEFEHLEIIETFKRKNE